MSDRAAPYGAELGGGSSGKVNGTRTRGKVTIVLKFAVVDNQLWAVVDYYLGAVGDDHSSLSGAIKRREEEDDNYIIEFHYSRFKLLKKVR